MATMNGDDGRLGLEGHDAKASRALAVENRTDMGTVHFDIVNVDVGVMKTDYVL